jgi:hypothetical protein
MPACGGTLSHWLAGAKRAASPPGAWPIGEARRLARIRVGTRLDEGARADPPEARMRLKRHPLGAGAQIRAADAGFCLHAPLQQRRELFAGCNIANCAEQ